MSSRALRKLQKGFKENENADAVESEVDAPDLDLPSQKEKHKDLFSLLQTEEDDHSENSEEQRDEQIESEDDHSSSQQPVEKVHGNHATPKKKNKKTKKKRASGLVNSEAERGKEGIGASKKKKPGGEVDDLDALLQSLSTSQNSQPDKSEATTNQYAMQLQELLSVESRHLHTSNEIRKLFGSSAIKEELGEENARQPARRRAHNAGRYSAGSQTLSSVSLKRNIFVQGKDSWPRATSGGLGMEVEEMGADDTILYRFVHSRGYQDVQMQFLMCVESMDPERLLQLLHFNRSSTLGD